MSTDSDPLSPHVPPPEEPSEEELTSQLEKAAQNWEAKADEESHSAEGKVSMEMLYRATESGMRQALHSMEEHHHDAEVQKAAEEAEENEGGKVEPPTK